MQKDERVLCIWLIFIKIMHRKSTKTFTSVNVNAAWVVDSGGTWVKSILFFDTYVYRRVYVNTLERDNKKQQKTKKMPNTVLRGISYVGHDICTCGVCQ